MSDDKNIAKFSKFTVVYYFSEFGMAVFKTLCFLELSGLPIINIYSVVKGTEFVLQVQNTVL